MGWLWTLKAWTHKYSDSCYDAVSGQEDGKVKLFSSTNICGFIHYNYLQNMNFSFNVLQ